MDPVQRFREWRVDRMTDRVARRPSGRKARETYGADDAHAFLWEPVLEALALQPDDRLLDVGCGGGAFLRRARESGCSIAGVDHSKEMVRLAQEKTGARIELAEVEAMPFADGEFTAVSCRTDDELVGFAREAGCREARIAHREPWAQLLFAQP